MTKAAVAKSWTLHSWPNGSRKSYALATFTIGSWVNVTPSAITSGSQDTMLLQGLAVDPNDSATWYVCNGPFVSGGGIFKTTNRGTSWTRVGNFNGGYIDNPLHVRVDPTDSNHLYAVAGVRGSNQGFFVSTDGGVNFTRPAGFATAATAASIAQWIDCYDVAVDPTDFDHILVTFHYEWGNSYGTNSGVMESTDGGTTWTVHDPESTWGTGHAIMFLYDPASSQGSSATWLIGTQSNGYWRTTNSGTSWTQVATSNIAHGGSQAYYGVDGTLYVAGEPILKSSDNGATMSVARTGSACWAITGDGTSLYYNNGNSNTPLQTALESANTSWSNLDATNYNGMFAMRYVAGLLICSAWNDGVFVKRIRAE